ncbi:hypothetical protein MmTuc01_0684 [Methanosarcina mazei Tuc01]|uniref:Uncharacterized protein n=1 Tax=Methanosarcina mazei Tuc01 TaxID=1236903 RepID=M1P6R2_METMZ|nr:hypothetical protein MmTuc01_0684 [Methanosarcina mazei Tuc01]
MSGQNKSQKSMELQRFLEEEIFEIGVSGTLKTRRNPHPYIT